LPEVADLLDQRHIKRVPVMRGSKMVGIISRADIVRALARMLAPAQSSIQQESVPSAAIAR